MNFHVLFDVKREWLSQASMCVYVFSIVCALNPRCYDDTRPVHPSVHTCRVPVWLTCIEKYVRVCDGPSPPPPPPPPSEVYNTLLWIRLTSYLSLSSVHDIISCFENLVDQFVDDMFVKTCANF